MPIEKVHAHTVMLVEVVFGSYCILHFIIFFFGRERNSRCHRSGQREPTEQHRCQWKWKQ